MNIPKNRRGADFIPYESNRVKLSPIRGVEGSDYINASYIDSYRLRSAFIATQTPLRPFVEDFWRMIWESGSSIIVQLDSCDFDKEVRVFEIVLKSTIEILNYRNSAPNSLKIP